jgi:hypothetical protein
MGLSVLGLGVLLGFPAHGEPQPPPVNTTPQKPVRAPLLNRDPCEYPKIYYCIQPTDVRIGKYILKIPYNLIGQWPPGDDFIELLPKWPGLNRGVKNESVKSDSYDIIHVLIHTARPRRPTEEGIRDLLWRLNLSPPIVLHEIGLLEYRNPRANNEVWAYIPIEQAGLLPRGQPLYIHTGGPGDSNTMECQFGYTLRDNLYVTVRFARKHIKDWKSITISVRDLVESFIQE